ncbi:unnamed protein product [Paramecium primaurelia]|uniref:Uncharacterized protein n=1 Tax=Paramecium primaurelia TaxID=5886 RepID=A0A8S1PM23_PARPR|nr:unnamed protein product [Paramecium primaurelia]
MTQPIKLQFQYEIINLIVIGQQTQKNNKRSNPMLKESIYYRESFLKKGVLMQSRQKVHYNLMTVQFNVRVFILAVKIQREQQIIINKLRILQISHLISLRNNNQIINQLKIMQIQQWYTHVYRLIQYNKKQKQQSTLSIPTSNNYNFNSILQEASLFQQNQESFQLDSNNNLKEESSKQRNQNN